MKKSMLPAFNGNLPVVGCWMVKGYACGVEIREEVARITTNQSGFVPHCFHVAKKRKTKISFCAHRRFARVVQALDKIRS